MKVEWKQFAQRRKINIEMFKTMSYKEYKAWCNIRKVEPVSEESFEGVQNIVVKKPPIKEVQDEEVLEIVTVSTHKFDELQLKKMRKLGILKLCEEFSLETNSADTKKQLIEKLLILNNLQ
jgi:hypothetical protein